MVTYSTVGCDILFCIVLYGIVIIDRARHSKCTSCRPSGIRIYYRIVTNCTACNLSLSAFHSLTISSSLLFSLPLFFTSCCLSLFLSFTLTLALPNSSGNLSRNPKPSCPVRLFYSHAVGQSRAKAFLFILLPLLFPPSPSKFPIRRSSDFQSLPSLPYPPPGASLATTRFVRPSSDRFCSSSAWSRFCTLSASWISSRLGWFCHRKPATVGCVDKPCQGEQRSGSGE